MTTVEALVLFNLPTLDGLNEASLKSAYRSLAKKTHPDVGGNPDTFIQIREAYSHLKLLLDQPEIIPETIDQNHPKLHPIYNQPDALRGYFEARIADLEERVQKSNQQWRSERERSATYEHIFNEQIRLIHQAKKDFEHILETWKNHHQFADDNWFENMEKTNLLHNTGAMNTLHFLAQKDELEANREQQKKQADHDFQSALLHLLNTIFSTFYTLLEL